MWKPVFISVLLFMLTTIAETKAEPAPNGFTKMPKCKVCHSKNPKMVAMHTALEFKDCFKCHGPGGLWPPEKRQEQMSTDPLCTRCHAPARHLSQ